MTAFFFYAVMLGWATQAPNIFIDSVAFQSGPIQAQFSAGVSIENKEGTGIYVRGEMASWSAVDAEFPFSPKVTEYVAAAGLNVGRNLNVELAHSVLNPLAQYGATSQRYRQDQTVLSVTFKGKSKLF